jgi:hypothetical protein
VKKVLIALGAGFAGLVVLGGIMFGAGYAFLLSHEAEATAYVDAAVQRVVGDWNDAALIAEASPELLQAASREQIRRLFQTFSERLGALKGSGGATRDAYAVNFTLSGRVLTVMHTVPAAFENGPATIRIRTIRRDGRWKILNFHVESDALLDRPRDDAAKPSRL